MIEQHALALQTFDSYLQNSAGKCVDDPCFLVPDAGLYELEQQTVFTNSWQLAARVDQLREPGQYVTWEISGEPVVIVRGSDGQLRGFFNVCRHHAAAVMTEPAGTAPHLRCPYHGWTYSLEGALKGAPDFAGVCNSTRLPMSASIQTTIWEHWCSSGLVPVNNVQSSLPSFLARPVNQIRLSILITPMARAASYQFRL